MSETAQQRAEIRDFLVSRRAKITPQAAGLPLWGQNRRVKGLRREEVALLAGVSVDYYTRLERGNLSGVSDSVLGALASALQLDEAERAHLFNLARMSSGGNARIQTRPAKTHVRPAVQWLLDSMTDVPAYVRTAHLNIVATNPLGRALYAPVLENGLPANTTRFVFLDERAPEFFVDWDEIAKSSCASLRSEAGRNPHDPAIQRLIGELSTRSEPFRTLWAAHDVKLHRTGTKRFNHPVIGEVTLHYEAMDLRADDGMTMITYAAEPGSKDADAIRLLANWTQQSHPAHQA